MFLRFIKYCLLIFVAAGLLTAGSCKKEDEQDPLLYQWTLKSIEKRGSQPVIVIDAPEDEPIKVLFRPYNLIDIDSWCNTGESNYIKDGSFLSISNFSMTEMFCPSDEPYDWEAIFSYNFVLAERYFVEDKSLTILTTGEYDLIFAR